MVDMFAEEVPDVVRPERATKEEIGEHICQKLAGKWITRRDVYHVFADEPYFDTEINQALTHLRKQGKVDYTPPLENNTRITIR
jgi:hypothetical protein